MFSFEDCDAVIVTASRERYRAGRKFPGNKPVTIRFADLTQEQADQLEADPLLSLRFVKLDGRDQDELILAVIKDLDPDKDFNQDGTPKVSAVTKALGREVSKAEIAKALESDEDE